MSGDRSPESAELANRVVGCGTLWSGDIGCFTKMTPAASSTSNGKIGREYKDSTKEGRVDAVP